MSDGREKKLAQLKEAFELGILDEDTYQALVAALEPLTQVGPRGVLVGGDVGGDIITGDVYYGEGTTDPQEALRIYRQVLVQSSGHLPLRGVDVGASDPTQEQRRLGLANVYVNLDTTAQVERSEADDRERADLALTEKLELADPQRLSKREMRPLAALEATMSNRRLVLLGDPGGGKSTFVGHLAHCLAAHVLEPKAGWLDHLPGWPAAESGLLPVVVILRDFARGLPDPLPARALPKHLGDFIKGRLADQQLDFAAEPVRQELEAGRAFILLDGLDEVPSKGQRAFVRDAVLAFVKRYPDNRYLLTCRVLAYQPPGVGEEDLRLPDAGSSSEAGFPTFELALLDEEKIDRFIGAWYQELARLGTVRGQDVDNLVQELRGAVRRPDLWRLAPNPLLLTVMALVHAHKGRLPDARALLYEDTVDMLLWRWEEVKSGGREGAVSLRQLLLEAGRTEMDLKRVLWQLAFEVHGQVGPDDEDEATAGIGELKLTKAVAALKDDDRNWAGVVIETMKLRAGLLLEREPEIFTFPHRTFQEYLAGAFLAAQADFAGEACRLAEEGNLWREVILLGAGRLVYLAGDNNKPLALVAELCPAGVVDEAPAWRKAWLAGEVLLEMGIKRAADSNLGREMLARVRGRLAQLLTLGRLAPRERAEAGDTLAVLGDPRPGVGARLVDERPLPEIALGYVPPGPFMMGSGEKDPLAEEREKPQHQVDIPYGYWIGQYPVTVAQFRTFIEESGYSPMDSDSLGDPDNRPVRWVTWYEVLKFCAWLEQSWGEAGWLPAGWRVTLPSEAEWEKAARGGLLVPSDPILRLAGREKLDTLKASLEENPLPLRWYPWGDGIDGESCNYQASGLQNTCAVGAFPSDVSAYGVFDLAGNVNEWTRSIWGPDWGQAKFLYPYNPTDGREELGSDDLRVIRGGSYADDERWPRCASRLRYFPPNWDLLIGFRVVASPKL